MREQIPIDQKTIESDWRLPVEFITPSGAILDTDAETGEALYSIQILYPAQIADIEIGEVVTRNIVVTMRRAALSELPDKSNYNKWFCRIPEFPNTTSDLKTYNIDMPREGGESLDFVRFYLRIAEQSS